MSAKKHESADKAGDEWEQAGFVLRPHKAFAKPQCATRCMCCRLYGGGGGANVKADGAGNCRLWFDLRAVVGQFKRPNE